MYQTEASSVPLSSKRALTPRSVRIVTGLGWAYTGYLAGEKTLRGRLRNKLPGSLANCGAVLLRHSMTCIRKNWCVCEGFCSPSRLFDINSKIL